MMGGKNEALQEHNESGRNLRILSGQAERNIESAHIEADNSARDIFAKAGFQKGKDIVQNAKIGDTVLFLLEENCTYALYEYILSDTGEIMYKDSEVRTIPLPLEDDRAFFTISFNNNVLYSHSTLPSLRGYKLITSRKNEEAPIISLFVMDFSDEKTDDNPESHTPSSSRQSYLNLYLEQDY